MSDLLKNCTHTTNNLTLDSEKRIYKQVGHGEKFHNPPLNNQFKELLKTLGYVAKFFKS